MLSHPAWQLAPPHTSVPLRTATTWHPDLNKQPWSPDRGRQHQQQHGPNRRRLPTAAANASGSGAAASTALGRHWSEEVLGVVIVDMGLSTPDTDALLLDFASTYRQEHSRQIVAVANSATLEQAMRGCVQQGATKVMVVPYLLSQGRDQGSDLPSALAEVQLKLPGIKCATGEPIPVASILAQHIENQVKVVEVKMPDQAPERWWSPANNAVAGSRPALTANRQQKSWQDVGNGVKQTADKQQPATQPSQPNEPAAKWVQREAAEVAQAWGNVVPAAAAVWSDDVGAVVIDYRNKPAEHNASTQGQAAPTSSPSVSVGDSSGATNTAAQAAGPAGPAYWFGPSSSSNVSSSSSSNGSSGSSNAMRRDNTHESASVNGSHAAATATPTNTAGAPANLAAGAGSSEAVAGAAGAQPGAAHLEDRLASLELQLQHLTDLLTERLVSPDQTTDFTAAGSAGFLQHQEPTLERERIPVAHRRSSSVRPQRARHAMRSGINSSPAAAKAAAAGVPLAAGGYRYVTADEAAVLSKEQCDFLERKRQAAAAGR